MLGVRGRALSHPRPLVLSGVRPGPTTHWLWVQGVRVWGPVTNPTARALASWLCALWGRHEGARGGRLLPGCGASGAGRSPTPDLSCVRACVRRACVKNRSPEHLSATLTGCESPDGYLEPAAVNEDADDQLSGIASTIPPVDPSCVDLKHSAFPAQLLLEEVDLESTSEPAPRVGKPVLHMQPMHTGEPVARSPDALACPASNNMPLSEHDTQELRRLLYLEGEGIERQERLQYLRQTWKSSIWSEEDDDSYTLPDPEIPLVYSLHYGQQCPSEWDDGSVPAETADRQKTKEHGKSNLHAEEDFLQKLESLNLDPRLKKLLITYEEVFGALPPPLSFKKLVQMDLKLKPEFEKTRVRCRPYPAAQEQVEEIERQIQECTDAGLVEEYKKGDYPHHCSPCFLVAKPGSTALRLVVDYGEVNKKTQNHSGSSPNMENTLERIAKCRYKTKMDKRSGFWQVDLTAAEQESHRHQYGYGKVDNQAVHQRTTHLPALQIPDLGRNHTHLQYVPPVPEPHQTPDWVPEDTPYSSHDRAYHYPNPIQHLARVLGDADSRALIQELQDRLQIPLYHSALRPANVPAHLQRQRIQLLRGQLPLLTRVARWLARKHIHVPEEHTRCPCNHTTPEDWEHFKKGPLHTGRDTLVGWSPAETL